MATISITFNLLGIGPYLTAQGIDYPTLMIFCLIWGMGGSFISLLLSKFMAKSTIGVQVIDPDKPGSPEEEWLVKTVAKLAKNAGLEKTPEVGVFNSQDPNAFATGPGRNDSLVAVSTGLFNIMGKDEIEGVLGHELTHVHNGDMVTMTLLMGVVNAFTMFLARIIAFFISQRMDSRGRYMAQFFIRMALDIILSILGSILVVMPFSRWREYRADAGGAKVAGKFKMINALKALQRAQALPPVEEPKALSAFMISSRPSWAGLFASHPPLEKRIAALESGSVLMSD
jgi:heat shock protein HtpX